VGSKTLTGIFRFGALVSGQICGTVVQGAKHANAQNEYSTGERLSLREKKSLKEYGY